VLEELKKGERPDYSMRISLLPLVSIYEAIIRLLSRGVYTLLGARARARPLSPQPLQMTRLIIFSVALRIIDQLFFLIAQTMGSVKSTIESVVVMLILSDALLQEEVEKNSKF